jgi:hypothetical protein
MRKVRFIFPPGLYQFSGPILVLEDGLIDRITEVAGNNNGDVLSEDSDRKNSPTTAAD